LNTKVKFNSLLPLWVFLFIAGLYIAGSIVYNGGFSIHTPGNPSYVIFRKLLNNEGYPGIFSIANVNDPMGNTIMPNSRWVIICPGDLVTLRIKTSGHISR
jgi:hypothetical protein